MLSTDLHTLAVIVSDRIDDATGRLSLDAATATSLLGTLLACATTAECLESLPVPAVARGDHAGGNVVTFRPRAVALGQPVPPGPELRAALDRAADHRRQRAENAQAGDTLAALRRRLAPTTDPTPAA